MSIQLRQHYFGNPLNPQSGGEQATEGAIVLRVEKKQMAHLLSFIDPSPQPDLSQPLNPATSTQPLEPLTSINTAHKSALVVANHPSLLKFLSRFFEEEEYTIRTASNSEEGMRLYGRCGPFTMVLIDYDVPQRNEVEIDYRLPQTSGRTLASDILKTNPSQGIVIAAHAYRSLDDLSLAQELLHIPVLIDLSICQLRNFLATVEVRRAVASLTVADKLRLRRSAAYWMRGVGQAARNRTGDDLLGEAQLRTLIGTRRWNRKVDFVQHLRGAMESISTCWKQKSGDKTTYLMSELLKFTPKGQESSPLGNAASHEPAADRSLIAKEEVARIFRMFTDDMDATQVLQGWYDDLKPNEIRQKYGLDEKRFAAAKKRIRVKTTSRRNGDGGGGKDGI
jgi:CheY-like chemotaxis protein